MQQEREHREVERPCRTSSTPKVGVGSISPDEPCVSECRLNASCCTTKSNVNVTIANVIARVRSAIHATGSEASATPAPTSGSAKNGL